MRCPTSPPAGREAGYEGGWLNNTLCWRQDVRRGGVLKEIFAFLGFTSPFFFFFLNKREKKTNKHTFRMGFMDPKTISAPCASKEGARMALLRALRHRTPFPCRWKGHRKGGKGKKKWPGPKCGTSPNPQSSRGAGAHGGSVSGEGQRTPRKGAAIF